MAQVPSLSDFNATELNTPATTPRKRAPSSTRENTNDNTKDPRRTPNSEPGDDLVLDGLTIDTEEDAEEDSRDNSPGPQGDVSASLNLSRSLSGGARSAGFGSGSPKAPKSNIENDSPSLSNKAIDSTTPQGPQITSIFGQSSKPGSGGLFGAPDSFQASGKISLFEPPLNISSGSLFQASSNLKTSDSKSLFGQPSKSSNVSLFGSRFTESTSALEQSLKSCNSGYGAFPETTSLGESPGLESRGFQYSERRRESNLPLGRNDAPRSASISADSSRPRSLFGNLSTLGTKD